jgi:hypothetical protein
MLSVLAQHFILLFQRGNLVAVAQALHAAVGSVCCGRAAKARIVIALVGLFN